MEGALFAITILGAANGMTIGRTVGHALSILESADIQIGGAARVAWEGREMATILLESDKDGPRGVEILAGAGLDVKAGAAGF
jgi:hypothetical protein